MYKIVAILLLAYFSGNVFCQNIPVNDTIVNIIRKQVAQIVDSEEIRIGGGRINPLVKLDTIGYISDSTAIPGFNKRWIYNIEVLKSYRSITIGNDTIQYIVIIKPKKRYYKKIKRYLIDNNIPTVPNSVYGL